ncbi:MAG: cytidine deaminase [Firmicutes bacterium]|nr:cytidine deaminase [Bacillota bacterium]
MNDLDLMNLARQARRQAYCPYSGVSVGAALLCTDGEVYLGCNIENSAFSPTICAERVAFAKAVYDGKRSFSAIAVSGGKADSHGTFPPCGVCRQVMAEFADPHDFRILLESGGEIKSLTLSQLLPLSFDKSNL